MSEFEDENPVLIQSHSRRGIAAFATPQFPLILFHDGAGTLFSYFLLQTLGRDVFGFEDPSVASGDKQTCGGGVREMAAYYYASMKGSMRPSPVILGGEYHPSTRSQYGNWLTRVAGFRVVVWRTSCTTARPSHFVRRDRWFQSCRHRLDRHIFAI